MEAATKFVTLYSPFFRNSVIGSLIGMPVGFALGHYVNGIKGGKEGLFFGIFSGQYFGGMLPLYVTRFFPQAKKAQMLALVAGGILGGTIGGTAKFRDREEFKKTRENL